MTERSGSDKIHWRTRLIHANTRPLPKFQALTTPVHRASTVVFERFAAVSDEWDQSPGFTYGSYGTPTTLELGARIAELEGAHHTFITPSGQAAISLVYFAYCRAGSHVLLPRNAYGSNAGLAGDLLRGLGIEVETYEVGIGADIARQIRGSTALVWCESPGSVTMEVEDVPAIVRAVHARNVPVVLDNTYAAGVFFDAFAHGVDVSIQALTKYVGGHSDVLLGSVSVANDGHYRRVGRAFGQLGMNASPDDCSLGLRGLLTMAVRLDRLQENALKVAHWLKARPEVERVLHPALPDCPGHDLWKRDFTGSTSVFSFVFRPGWTPARVAAWMDSLTLFRMGFSWGGVTSLAMAFPTLSRLPDGAGARLVRLNIGLEDTDDLTADLARAFDRESHT